jgi:hypothetical protein
MLALQCNFNNAPGIRKHLIYGTLFFAFQIYGDFGLLRYCWEPQTFGIELLQNFSFLFSEILLSFGVVGAYHYSWFKDYVYIPTWEVVQSSRFKVSMFVSTFFIERFWRRPIRTFIVWGFACLVFLCLYSAKNRKHIEIVALSNTWPE